MEINTAADLPQVSWPRVFWRALQRIDQSKLNSYGMALRNALAVAIPLAIGIAIGNPLGAVAVATGALNVAYSDGKDPYPHRARRMLTWSFLGAFAVFLGSVTGNFHILAILVASAWALVAGLLVSISTRAADLGLNTLVALIVYAARGAMSPKGAFYAGLLVLAGGLLQTALALLAWPLGRYGPERRAIGGVYAGLAQQAASNPEEVLAAPLKQPSPEIQDILSSLGRDHSIEGERFRLLFDQVDRLRFSLYGVIRLRGGLKHNIRNHQSVDKDSFKTLDTLVALSAKILRNVGESLLNDAASIAMPDLLARLRKIAGEAQHHKTNVGTVFAQEFASAADVLAGQLRIVAQLSDITTSRGAEEFAKHDFAPPLKLQVRSWLATMQANLHFKSPAFRHGIRLAICVAIGDAIGRSINTQRNYWLAMTVAVVLKPDFTTTLSRGVLRLCGTFGGLVLATGLYHALPQSALSQLLLVGIFTFLLRYAGPANYGLFSVAISGLIVFLIATTGVPPAEVIGERAINTTVGGIFALLAYALWPTWERTQVSDVMAEMIDGSRDYLRAVASRFTEVPLPDTTLDETREAWRQARSAAEASVDRFSSEPGVDPAILDSLTSMLSSSHALVRAIMGLETAVVDKPARQTPPAFQQFAHDAEFTLYYLAAALRGSSAAAETLPQLREDHRRLVQAYEQATLGDDYILIETDRLTVNLNTLREQVIRFVLLTGDTSTPAAHATVK